MAEPEAFTFEMSVEPDDTHKTATLREKHHLHSDEPGWLPEPMAGDDAYPAPVDFLLMSLATCQVSVLNQCLEKNGVEDYRIECEAIVDEQDRDENHPDHMPRHTAVRIGHITVKMSLVTTPAFEADADHCLTVYDEGCIVGQSLSGGVDYTPLTALEVRESLD